MSITYEDIKRANEATKTTPITRKSKDGGVITNEYVEVNQRIKAFRMVYPDGFITTDEIESENGISKFKAICGFYPLREDGTLNTMTPCVIGTGHAFEREGSNFINATSHLENAETSAIGRCLASAGFGINESVASYEEVANAKANQKEDRPNRKASENQIAVLEKVYTGERLRKLLEANNIEKLEDISMTKASELIGKLKEKAEEKEEANV